MVRGQRWGKGERRPLPATDRLSSPTILSTLASYIFRYNIQYLVCKIFQTSAVKQAEILRTLLTLTLNATYTPKNTCPREYYTISWLGSTPTLQGMSPQKDIYCHT